MKRRWLGLLAVFYGCAGEPPPPPPPSLPPRGVHVAKADRSPRPVLTELVGTVRSVHDAAIAPLVSGTVTEVRVRLGSLVRAGEVLVRLSAGELDARREQARAVSALAARERDRATALKEQGAITVAQYEAAHVALERRPRAGGRGEHRRRPDCSPRAVRRRDHRQARQRRRNGAPWATAAHLGEPRGQPIRGAGPRDRQPRAGGRPALAGPYRGSRPGARGAHRRDRPVLRRRDQSPPGEDRSAGDAGTPLGPVRPRAAPHRPGRHGDRPLSARSFVTASSRPCSSWSLAPPACAWSDAAGSWTAARRSPPASPGARRSRWRKPPSSSTGSACRSPHEPHRSTRPGRHHRPGLHRFHADPAARHRFGPPRPPGDRGAPPRGGAPDQGAGGRHPGGDAGGERRRGRAPRLLTRRTADVGDPRRRVRLLDQPARAVLDRRFASGWATTPSVRS